MEQLEQENCCACVLLLQIFFKIKSTVHHQFNTADTYKLMNAHPILHLPNSFVNCTLELTNNILADENHER